MSVNDGEPESILLLVLEEDNALLLRAFDGLEVNRFHDPLMLDEDPLISFCRVWITVPLLQSLNGIIC